MRYNLAVTTACLAATSVASPSPTSPSSGVSRRDGLGLLSQLPANVVSSFTADPVFSDNFSGPAGAFQDAKWQYYNGSGTTKPVNDETEIYPQQGQTCALSGQNTLQIAPQKVGGNLVSCRLSSAQSWKAEIGQKIAFVANLRLGTSTQKLGGFWPAFWALGEDGRSGPNTPWPTCGEIDTMENINGDGIIHSTVHCGPACKDNPGAYEGITGMTTGDAYTMGDYATFAHIIDRTDPDETQHSITFYVNQVQVNKVTYANLVGNDASTAKASWAALTDAPFYIVMNVALGGGWPGPVDPNLPMGLASGMEVKGVEVHLTGGAAASGAPAASTPAASAGVTAAPAPSGSAAAPAPAQKRATSSFTA